MSKCKINCLRVWLKSWSSASSHSSILFNDGMSFCFDGPNSVRMNFFNHHLLRLAIAAKDVLGFVIFCYFGACFMSDKEESNHKNVSYNLVDINWEPSSCLKSSGLTAGCFSIPCSGMVCVNALLVWVPSWWTSSTVAWNGPMMVSKMSWNLEDMDCSLSTSSV